MKSMKRCALSTFVASAGMAAVSIQVSAPSTGIEYSIDTPRRDSAARFAACLTSPEKPKARHASPLASALM